jgi:hypothetical protein
MGSCYSSLGSKSRPNSTQSPLDKSNEQIISENKTQNITQNKVKSKSHKHLSSSFENISYSEVLDTKHNKTSMSSSNNRHKIPIPSSKLISHNKVVPTKGSQEFGLKKYQSQVRRYSSGIDANKDIQCDNSSSTSISSGGSVNLSKSSFKSSSSSALSVRQQSSIPKPKSRSPTPPMALKYATHISRNSRNVSQQQYSDKTNRSKVNNSSLINDRLNGNRTQTNNETLSNDINQNRNSISNESNNSKQSASNTGISIKYTTQLSGLPRPQTAHIVSTSSHNDNTVNKMNYCSDNENRLLKYSEKTQQVRCDQNLRQVNKPVSYYYGMNKQCPYKRPINTNLSTNRLQFQSLSTPPMNPRISSANNSQQIRQKPNNLNEMSSNSSAKTQLDFGETDYITVKSFNDNKINNSQNSMNINKFKPEVSESISRQNANQIENMPKSIQRIKEVVPIIARKDSKIGRNNSAINVKPVETSPEHNSISSASGTEADNRDFLIDDEISDQPELVLSSSVDKNDLIMKNLHSELEGLILKQESSVSPSTPSSPTVPLSNSSSTTITPNTTFRRPRPLSFVEMPDGSYGLDSPSFRAACQDLIGIKTLLFRLHGILQNVNNN